MKYLHQHRQGHLVEVAPHWGAWIEICMLCASLVSIVGRTPLGCVD